jgi:hypothetical protein
MLASVAEGTRTAFTRFAPNWASDGGWQMTFLKIGNDLSVAKALIQIQHFEAKAQGFPTRQQPLDNAEHTLFGQHVRQGQRKAHLTPDYIQTGDTPEVGRAVVRFPTTGIGL